MNYTKRKAYSKEFEYTASVENVQLHSFEYNINTVHVYYSDLFMTEWNPIAFSYTGTLPGNNFQIENNNFLKIVTKVSIFSSIHNVFAYFGLQN